MDALLAATNADPEIRYPLLVVLVSAAVVLVSIVWYAFRRRGGSD